MEDFYKYSPNSTSTFGYYYLNTFDNLMTSYMTLFELTVVNNWFILMNAYAVTVGMYTRGYFMVFYLITMIVMTIVVSSFLEAFRFRIQYKRSTTKRDGKILLQNSYFFFEDKKSKSYMTDILSNIYMYIFLQRKKCYTKKWN